MVSDAAIDSPPEIDACTTCPRVVARYAFDGTLDDSSGHEHHASPAASGLSYVPGVSGQAVLIPASLASYLVIPDHSAFDIANGSVEVSFRYDGGAAAGDLGLVSRDANGTTMDGHFTIRLGHDRRVVVRLQRMSDPTIDAYRCTASPVTSGAWHRVVASFGPDGFVVEVDGVATTGTSWTEDDDDEYSCTTPWTMGIAGNNNPWVVGALSAKSNEGTGSPVTGIAGDVEIDELVIRQVP